MAKPKSFAYFCALVSLFCCFLCLYLSLALSLCVSACFFLCSVLYVLSNVFNFCPQVPFLCIFICLYISWFPCFPSPTSASPSVLAVAPSTVVAADYRPHMCTYLSKLALSNSLIKQLVNIETTRKTTTNYTHTHIQRQTCMCMFICILYPALNCADKILVNCVNDAR